MVSEHQIPAQIPTDNIEIPLAEMLEPNYFLTRMKELGIAHDKKEWSIEVWDPDADIATGPDTYLQPIFTEDSRGNIRILVYTINQDMINYFEPGSGKLGNINGKNKHYYVTRLKVPLISKSGDFIKYLMPKGQGTFPFFPPKICQKFKDKTKITTLVITEGYFKAAKASLHGLDIVGLSSITHMKDKTGELHHDIKKLIITCQVENIIWLADGDCLNLTGKDIMEADLYKRPHQFFASANIFKDLTSKFDIKKYFAHVLSEKFPAKKDSAPEQFPKGLDDALVSMPDKELQVIEDLTDLSREPVYFYRADITFNIGKLHTYFNLGNVTLFYLFYVNRYPDLDGKEFRWNGTRYKYNAEKNECEIIIPAEANNYFRVGDQYHSWVHVPNKHSMLEKRFERRQKSTIADDHGKSIFKHIPKYQAFCNVPDHKNFQPVIHNCFNVYAQFEHEEEEGEFPQTEKFLKHIFGNALVNWTDPDTKEKRKISEYDLALDYVSLLFQKPTQILPILCLVSRENNTGKSTFAHWLKLIFTQNAAIIGNAELVDNFNASWATKLIICCDETKIDKQEVIEKVKRLSTADKIFLNSKGKDHYELDFFGKFLFLSNNEENFIYASDDDVRYWIRKIPVIKELNINLIQDLKDEIPGFLHFLNKRQMVCPNRHRAWFDPELIKTEALKKVIEHSLPTIEKEIRIKIKEMFFDFDMDEILMAVKDIKEMWFKHKNYEENYIENVLKNKLKLNTYRTFEYNGKTYKTIDEIFAEHPDVKTDITKLAQVTEKQKTKRYGIPCWEAAIDSEGHEVMKRVNKTKPPGRPFIFPIEKFLTPAEIAGRDYDDETRNANMIMNGTKQTLMNLPAPAETEIPIGYMPF